MTLTRLLSPAVTACCAAALALFVFRGTPVTADEEAALIEQQQITYANCKLLLNLRKPSMGEKVKVTITAQRLSETQGAVSAVAALSVIQPPRAMSRVAWSTRSTPWQQPFSFLCGAQPQVFELETSHVPQPGETVNVILSAGKGSAAGPSVISSFTVPELASEGAQADDA